MRSTRARGQRLHETRDLVRRPSSLSDNRRLCSRYASGLAASRAAVRGRAEIATAERAWRGSNRTGWLYPEFDRVYDGFSKALDRGERNRLMAEMARLLNDQLPVMPMYFNFEVVAHVVGLAGPEVATPATTEHGKVHLWEWR